MKFTKQFQNYQSDLTKYVAELRQKNPNLEALQRAGRARLSDVAPMDLDQQARLRASNVPQPSYVYYNWNKPKP
ncbi:MAG: DUF3460 family protein [Herbaspirillum sp.]